MKTKFYLLFWMSVVLYIFFGCEKAEIMQNNNSADVKIQQRSGQPMQLGAQKENPFSVDNMKKALDTLVKYAHEEESGIALRSAATNMEITPTDLYVRFRPKNDQQDSLLRIDTTLKLMNFPLDYEIIQDGDYYVDSLDADSPYIWYYTTVKPGYIPIFGVEYEILSELFIPENSPYYYEEDVLNVSNAVNANRLNVEARANKNILKALTSISFVLTGNENDLNPNIKPLSSETICKRYCLWFICWTDCDTYYYPEGYIKLNTPTGNVGLKGVKIRMWRWFTITDTRTNANGYYKSSHRFDKLWVWNDPYYYVIFDGYHSSYGRSWDISKSIAGTVCLWDDSYSCGAHSPNGYSMTFYTNSSSWGKCVLNNAVYDYMAKASADGIALPPLKLEIACKNSTVFTSSAPMLRNHQNMSLFYAYPWTLGMLDLYGYVFFNWAMPDLILRYTNNINRYNEMITVVWHELTHASQVARMTSEKGKNWASTYWSKNVYRQAANSIATGNPYGNKGNQYWEIIALSEGWANYREEYLARMYLGVPNYVGTTNLFLRPYVEMFKKLRNIGCSFTNIEKSLCANTIVEFRNNLIVKYPNLTTQITNAIPL
jgi:hypothetical protein